MLHFLIFITTVITSTYSYSYELVSVKEVRSGVQSYHYRLDNGLDIVLTENTKAPLASIYHWVKVGSLHERPGITGISHLFEHMMFRPVSEGDPNFFDQIRLLGGSANANTRYMATVYTTTSPHENLLKVLEIEANRFQNLKVTDDLLDIERKAVWSEYSTKFDTNSVIDIWGKIYEVSFPNHPYEWTIIGYREDLNKITAKDCNDFFQKFYRPNNIGLFISGDIKANRLIRQIARLYGNWEAGESSVLPKDFDKPTKLTIATGRIPTRSNQVIAGFRLKEEKKYHLEYRFLNHILFSSKNSLAERKIKNEAKLVSAISDFNFDYDSGMMKVFMISLTQNMNSLVNHILALKKDFESLDQESFNAYKQEFITSFMEGILRNDSMNEEMALHWGKMEDLDLFFTLENRIRALGKESLLSLLNNFYTKNNLSLVRAKQEK